MKNNNDKLKKNQNLKSNKELTFEEIKKLSPKEYDKYLLENKQLTKEQLEYINQDYVSAREIPFSQLSDAENSTNDYTPSHDDIIDKAFYEANQYNEIEDEDTKLDALSESISKEYCYKLIYKLIEDIHLPSHHQDMFIALYIDGISDEEYQAHKQIKPDTFRKAKQKLNRLLKEHVFSKLKSGNKEMMNLIKHIKIIAPSMKLGDDLDKHMNKAENEKKTTIKKGEKRKAYEECIRQLVAGMKMTPMQQDMFEAMYIKLMSDDIYKRHRKMSDTAFWSAISRLNSSIKCWIASNLAKGDHLTAEAFERLGMMCLNNRLKSMVYDIRSESMHHINTARELQDDV